MRGSIELHLLCHGTLLYCQVDPNPKPKAKFKAKKSLLPLPILPLMWQPLAHLNQSYSSNSLPFMQVFLPCGFSLSCITLFSVSHGVMWTVAKWSEGCGGIQVFGLYHRSPWERESWVRTSYPEAQHGNTQTIWHGQFWSPLNLAALDHRCSTCNHFSFECIPGCLYNKPPIMNSATW